MRIDAARHHEPSWDVDHGGGVEPGRRRRSGATAAMRPLGPTLARRRAAHRRGRRPSHRAAARVPAKQTRRRQLPWLDRARPVTTGSRSGGVHRPALPTSSAAPIASIGPAVLPVRGSSPEGVVVVVTATHRGRGRLAHRRARGRPARNDVPGLAGGTPTWWTWTSWAAASRNPSPRTPCASRRRPATRRQGRSASGASPAAGAQSKPWSTSVRSYVSEASRPASDPPPPLSSSPMKTSSSRITR